jgi:hypothetical protein
MWSYDNLGRRCFCHTCRAVRSALVPSSHLHFTTRAGSASSFATRRMTDLALTTRLPSNITTSLFVSLRPLLALQCFCVVPSDLNCISFRILCIAMFYSHEGKTSTPTHSQQKSDPRSPYIAQIWRRNRLVSKEGAQLLPPTSDTNGRLVATLGSKSSLKRINRKQILDVDVAKACKTIIDPVAPMALRLQGNLL